jgi:hypothetical protein
VIHVTAIANQNGRTNKLIAKARQQEIRNELIRQFRNEIRPVAERIAKQRGATMVLLPTDQLLWFDRVTDITDELIAELRAVALSGTPQVTSSTLRSGQPRTASASSPSDVADVADTPSAKPVSTSEVESAVLPAAAEDQ